MDGFENTLSTALLKSTKGTSSQNNGGDGAGGNGAGGQGVKLATEYKDILQCIRERRYVMRLCTCRVFQPSAA